ncbi:hypothetical protein [Brevibacillus brevis]|nr:hypothetical protein [Brevibacillus brevis]MBY0086984.1 hypothetical protein [Brevibacillus brevis]
MGVGLWSIATAEWTVPDDRQCYESYTDEQVGDRYVVDICVPVKHF